MRGLGWKTVFCTAGLSVQLVAGLAEAQEPAPPAPPSAPAAQTPSATMGKAGKQKYSHANDYLIRGTVFNEKALSFPGVQLRIRLTSEKKFRWESYTNSRGEFALRVPQGSVYEMVVRVKGFEEQTRTIDAKNGGDAENMVFRMQPADGGKK
jgi:hypothetical protein